MRVDTSRGQWVGVALVLATCGVFAFAIPTLAPNATTTNARLTKVDAGARVEQGPVSVEPGEGWSRSTEVPGLFLLKQANSNLIIEDPVASTGQSMVDVVTAAAQSATDDETIAYEVGQPTTFTTASGLEGAKLVVSSPNSTSVNAAVTDGKRVVTVTLDADPGDWAVIGKGVDDLLTSIELGTSETESSS